MNTVQQSTLFQQISNVVAAAAAAASVASSPSSSNVSLNSIFTNSQLNDKLQQYSLEPINVSLSNHSYPYPYHNIIGDNNYNSTSVSSISPVSSCSKRQSPPLFINSSSGFDFGPFSTESMSTLTSSMIPSGKSCSPLTGQDSSPKRTLSPVSRHQIEMQLRQLQMEQQQIMQQLQLSSHRQYLLSKLPYTKC